MIKSILSFVLLSSFCLLNGISNAQVPDWLWAKSEGGANFDLATSIVVDPTGNIYVAGNFESSTITLGSTVLTNIGGYKSDIFLVKYDANGNVLWAKSAGGPDHDNVNSIALDASGNCYIAGHFFSNSCKFRQSTNEYLTLWNSGYDDMFLVKYDVNGNAVWARNATGFDRQEAFSVTVDASGNPYVAGYFFWAIKFETIQLLNANMSFGGRGDVFLAKYNTNGDVLWAKSAGGTGNDIATSCVVDSSGNIYVTGWFATAFTFGSDSLSSVGGYDVFLTKYDISGNVVWAKSAGGTDSDLAYSVALDFLGNIYIAGNFRSEQINFGSTNLQNSGYFTEDVFLAKYNADGNELWAKSAVGSGNDQAFSVAVDTWGNPYLAGSYSSASIFFGSHLLTNTNLNDYAIFLSKYNANGNAVWATSMNGTEDEQANCVAVDVSENVYLSGYFRSPTLNCGPHTLTNAGHENLFLAKLNCKSLGIDKQNNTSPTSVYPNPATDVVTIETSENLSLSELAIVDMSGREHINLQITEPITQIDVRSLPGGVYMIKLAGLKGVQICKFVKE